MTKRRSTQSTPPTKPAPQPVLEVGTAVYHHKSHRNGTITLVRVDANDAATCYKVALAEPFIPGETAWWLVSSSRATGPNRSRSRLMTEAWSFREIQRRDQALAKRTVPEIEDDALVADIKQFLGDLADVSPSLTSDQFTAAKEMAKFWVVIIKRHTGDRSYHGPKLTVPGRRAKRQKPSD